MLATQAADLEPPLLSRAPSSATTSDSRITTTTGGGSGGGGGGGHKTIREKLGLGGVARRTLGIGLLLIVVFLWTLSNFLASVSVPCLFFPLC
jgi:solute carrier family 35 protein F5